MKENLIKYVKKSTKLLASQAKIEFELDKIKVFYGVGANTLRTIALSNICLDSVSYFCDKNPIFHGRYVADKIIKSPSELINDIIRPDVIIFSPIYFNEIKEELEILDFQGRIISYF